MTRVESLEGLEDLLLKALPFLLRGINLLAFRADQAQLFYLADGVAKLLLSHIDELEDHFHAQGEIFTCIDEGFGELGRIAAVKRFQARPKVRFAASVTLGRWIDYEPARQGPL